MLPISVSEARKLLVWTVIVAQILMAAVLLSSKISVDITSSTTFMLLIAVPVLCRFYVYWRKMEPLYEATDVLVAFFLVTIPIIVWTYAAMGLAKPLADAELSALDLALGFDWHFFIGLVDSNWWLSTLLGLAYSSIFVQLLVFPIWLGLRQQRVRAYALVFSYALLCLFASIISIWYPALGTYVFYGVGPNDVVNINAKYGFFFLEQLYSVRDQSAFLLDFKNTAGLLTFPSCHVGVAVICAWAAWNSPLLRYPFLVLNIAMSVSAISHGSHYLIDVIAGAGLAGIVISITTAIFYRPAASKRPLVWRNVQALGERLKGKDKVATGLPAATSD